MNQVSRMQVADTVDLDSEANIRTFIDSFYLKVLADEVLEPIFNDVAAIDINVHIPIIVQYWQKLLLGQKGYSRHTMNIHRDVHRKSAFTAEAFDRWLTLFTQTARLEYSGPYTDKAIKIATSIAENMHVSLYKYPNANL